MRHIKRIKASHVLLVLAQELAAGGKIIVNYVEDLTLDPFDQTSQNDRLCAVVDVGEGDGVGAAHVQEESECTEANPACDLTIAPSVNATGPDHDIGDSKPLAVLGDKLLLPDFRKAIGVRSEFRMFLDRARFVQKPPPGLPAVSVNRERAHENKSSQTPVL